MDSASTKLVTTRKQPASRDGVLYKITFETLNPLNVKIPAARFELRKTFSVLVFVKNGTICPVRLRTV
jgi:hypothetical protein